MRFSRLVGPVLALAMVAAACGGSNVDPEDLGPELATIDHAALVALLSSDPRPAVVNIWASWCLPCRSEAPLLDAAHEEFGDEVQFIGVAVEDTQLGARSFIAEFGVEFENYFDRNGSVPAALRRVGVPITFFFAADGTLISAHSGVIDERTLAINIDELLAR